MSSADVLVAILLLVSAALASRAVWIAIQARSQLPRLQDALASALGAVGADWPTGGLPAGSILPAFQLRGLDGEWHHITQHGIVAIDETPTETPDGPEIGTLVVLTKGGELLNERLGAVIDRLPSGIRATVVIDVPDHAAHARLARATPDVLLDPGGAFAAALRVDRLPAAVVVDSAGRTSTPFAIGPVPVRELIDLVHDSLRRPADVPEQFEAFTVIDREGAAATIAVDGRPLLIAILGNTCRHSTRLIPELRAFAARDDRPDLRVVIAGGFAPVDPMIDAPLLIDNTDQASVRFGYRGTPTLVHISADGTIIDIVSGTRACTETLRNLLSYVGGDGSKVGLTPAATDDGARPL